MAGTVVGCLVSCTPLYSTNKDSRLDTGASFARQGLDPCRDRPVSDVLSGVTHGTEEIVTHSSGFSDRGARWGFRDHRHSYVTLSNCLEPCTVDASDDHHYYN